MRNAFDVLVASAKGTNKANSRTPARTPASNKGTYTTCPLCQRTVPVAFAEAHVSVCLATPGPLLSGQPRGTGATPSGRSQSPPLGATRTTQMLAASQPQHKHQTQATPGPTLLPGPHGDPSSEQQQQQHEQPEQQRQVSLRQQGGQHQKVALHVDLADNGDLDVVTEYGHGPLATCPEDLDRVAEQGREQPQLLSHQLDRPGEGTQQSGCAAASGTMMCLTTLEGGMGGHEQHRPIQQQQLTQPAAGCGPAHPTQQRESRGLGLPPSSQAPSAPSAFDIMRQSQLRAASRCHTFFLERTQDGCWLGHCWAKGCASPAQQRLASGSCWSVTLSVSSGGRSGLTDGTSGKETVCLLTNVPPGAGGTISWSTAGLVSNALPPEGRWRGGPSALKSALQKTVRLGRGGCAVRAALQLFKEDGGAAQLLRRLSVVCVEDAILHPGLPLVVWLMAAQAKGYVLGGTHVEALLAVVYQLAMVQVRDGVPDSWDGDDPAVAAGAVSSSTLQAPVLLSQVDDFGLAPAEACLVKCLLMRASYGGMGGDVRMMRGFAAYWAARFKGAAGAAAPPPASSQPSTASSGGLKEARKEATANPAGQLGLRSPLSCDVATGCPAPSSNSCSGQHAQGAALQRHSALTAQPGQSPGSGAPKTDGAGPGTCGPGGSAGTNDGGNNGGRGHERERAGGGLEKHGEEPFSTATVPRCERGGQVRDENGNPVATVAAPAEAFSGGATAGGPPLRALDSNMATKSLRDVSPGAAAGGVVCSQMPREGPSQAAARPGVSDAYFAVRLQAEDAPPSCGGFMPASQLLAEALSDQKALQRLVAATTQRQLQQSQAAASSASPWQLGRQWPGGQLAVWAQHGLCTTESPQPPCTQQATQPQGAGVVRPKWQSAAAAAVATASGSGDGGGGGRQSPWLTFLCALYDQVPVPVSLSQAGSVGPMRRSDVPLSAVDFHVSDVVTQLLERPDVQAQAPGGRGSAPEDLEDALKSAMWLFRSSKNPKAWVHSLSPCCKAAPDGACPEHRSLESQLDREAQSRERLAALWSAAAPWADRYSVAYIARRFGPP